MSLTKLVCVAAFALATASLIPASAGAADVNRPLILIHGHEHDSGASCRGNWDDLMANFRVYGYKGPFRVIRYYKNDTACGTYYGPGSAPQVGANTSDTKIDSIAWAVAWHIYNAYNKRGIGVNVIAHSMGGLIIRDALAKVQRHTPGWPPVLTIPDIVTLATPHNGVDTFGFGCYFGNNDDECFEMDKSSSFIEWLRSYAQAPHGAFGTYWSLIGSHADNLVDEGSATGMNAQFKVHYASDTHIEHPDYMHEKRTAPVFATTAHAWLSSDNGRSWTEAHTVWPIQAAWYQIAINGY